MSPGRRVRRMQFPMTSACAFTDYFLQGQTISHAIVDIARPPSCGPNLFNLYYLVCCIIQEFRPCRHPIDFDEKKFLFTHSAGVLGEHGRLADLDEQTGMRAEYDCRGIKRTTVPNIP
ncbi:hypothetical protein F5141DRAFT_1114481 [Pisolithus sp. B1]|nr:hypothetical protein F5141DRAFT_1114481 [Pisolithus sp. B1]